MICDQCRNDAERVVYCDCFAVLCHQCFAGHRCGHEGAARFTGGGDELPVSRRDPAELSNALFRLRPYQQMAIDSILEALT